MKITVIKKVRSWNQRGIDPPPTGNFNSASGRWFKYVKTIFGKKFYKAEREKLKKKLKTKCSKCQNFLFKNRTAIYL